MHRTGEAAGKPKNASLQREIELDRVAGDTRLTYILCPELPSNYRVSKVFAPTEDTPKNQSVRTPAPFLT
jgi:hypothetical protein